MNTILKNTSKQQNPVQIIIQYLLLKVIVYIFLFNWNIISWTFTKVGQSSTNCITSTRNKIQKDKQPNTFKTLRYWNKCNPFYFIWKSYTTIYVRHVIIISMNIICTYYTFIKGAPSLDIHNWYLNTFNHRTVVIPLNLSYC